MKKLAPLLALLVLAGSAAADGLTVNDFFKAVEGKWKGEGTITNANLEETPAINNLVCEFVDGGKKFTITGNLRLGNEGEAAEATPIQYRWEYEAGTLDGLYAGRFVNLGGGEVTDYEVSIDEANLTAKLSQISGASGDPRIEMTNKVVEGKYHVNFTMTDSNGQEVLKGALIFDREE